MKIQNHNGLVYTILNFLKAGLYLCKIYLYIYIYIIVKYTFVFVKYESRTPNSERSGTSLLDCLLSEATSFDFLILLMGRSSVLGCEMLKITRTILWS